MKNWFLVLIILIPLFSKAQDNTGGLTVGAQFYQNTLLPDDYEGFGIGLNCKLNVIKGVGFVAHSFYETNDLINAGSLKRFQNGLAINYAPLYKKNFSPWINIGVAYNVLNILPVSYLFVDNSNKKVSQSYLSLNAGLGVQYVINDLRLNVGFYFQPQNYSPDYVLVKDEEESVLLTNAKALNIKVEPLLYFNIGFTYQIFRLWEEK